MGKRKGLKKPSQRGSALLTGQNQYTKADELMYRGIMIKGNVLKGKEWKNLQESWMKRKLKDC